MWKLGRVDRLLQVHAVVHVAQEGVQRPLVLQVAARRAERQVRLAAAQRQRRRQRRPRALARARARSDARGRARTSGRAPTPGSRGRARPATPDSQPPLGVAEIMLPCRSMMSRWHVSPRVSATYSAHVRVVGASVSASMTVSGCGTTVEPAARSDDAPAVAGDRAGTQLERRRVADQRPPSALYGSDSSVASGTSANAGRRRRRRGRRTRAWRTPAPRGRTPARRDPSPRDRSPAAAPAAAGAPGSAPTAPACTRCSRRSRASAAPRRWPASRPGPGRSAGPRAPRRWCP